MSLMTLLVFAGALMMAAENNQLDSEAGQSFASRHRAELERVAGGRPLDGQA